METLGVLDVDGLDVRVELLLGAVLVVTLTRDADTEAERNALDAGLPDLLVQLGVEADVGGALERLALVAVCGASPTYHGLLSETTDLLDGAGSPLLEADAVDLYTNQPCSPSVFRPIPAQLSRHPNQRNRSGRVPAQLCRPLMDFNKLNQHTRLWRWIVYSRATTSAMALRWVLPEAFLVEDISARR